MMKDLTELTTKCIRCGFCLESCPTFRETGDEIQSPRGRIYLARSAAEGKLSFPDIAPALDLCLGCRACETACPSGVEYGHILELARKELPQPLAKKALLGLVTSGWFMRGQLFAGRVYRPSRIPSFVSRAVSGEPAVVRPPMPSKSGWSNEPEFPPVIGEVAALRGCVMGDLFPRVHQATARLLRRVGYSIRWLDGCCGALHAHQGQWLNGKEKAHTLLAKAEIPLVLNSAGCGAHLRGQKTTNQVVDLTEFLVQNGLLDLLEDAPGIPATITYHDACHLAHGQGVTSPPRQLIQAIPHLDYVELPDADHCCGSAGLYNVLQPAMASKLGAKKLQSIRETKCHIIAMGNPGCQAWIHQLVDESPVEIMVLHTAELLESAFSGLPE